MVSYIRRHFALSAGIIALGLAVAAISIPNLLRSRTAVDEATRRVGTLAEPIHMAMSQQAASAPKAQRVAAELVSGTEYEQKIIRTVSLELQVGDLAEAAQQLRDIAVRFHGYIEKASVTGGNNGAASGSLTLRVPAAQLEAVLAEVKGTGRVQREDTDARDVTREYVDTAARLRNFRAEEAQYLDIMRRAGSIKDTLAVAERLSDVRGRIEQLQGELNLLSRQVEMATIQVSLRPLPVASAWRPGENARAVWADMLSALGDYANGMIAVLVYLPVLLVWGGTLVVCGLAVWKTGLWVRRRFPNLAAK